MKTAKTANCGTFIFALVVGIILLDGPADAQTVPSKLVAFNDFLQEVSRAAPASFVARPASRVKTAKSFEEMRQHVLTMYGGVTVKHSFLLGSDTYDCIPISQQPSVRLRKLKSIATEPPSVPSPAGSGTGDSGSSPGDSPAAQPVIETDQLGPGQMADALGNSVLCEEQTIPMRRITLEELSRFESLHQFFEKGPNGAGRVPTPGGQLLPLVTATHKYAHSYQSVTNLGGSSALNLWNPNVNTGLQEIFSLSQHWYVNYIGSSPQTVEGGWQNFPQKYGSHNSVLFIYWTADGYKNTGCYNLDCVAFVQTNKNWFLGGKFAHYSVNGGAQYAFTLKYYLFSGNWWLNLNGQWVGYYPGKLYAGGPLATSASSIDYGGETVGTTIWPPMGSGRFASTGRTHAAFQRNIFYIRDATHSFYATLFVSQPSPSCYKDITKNNTKTSGWNTYFYFGGPGGKTC